MIYFLKNHQHRNLGHKLGLLYFLNITDILFTIILIQTGLFLEANPFMASILESPWKTTCVKGILPAGLFIYLYLRLKHANDQQLRQSNAIILIMVFFYLMVNILHLIWFSFIPIFS